MSELIKVTIDNKVIEVPGDYTVMDAAYAAGIDIPRLCFLKGINETSACRVCVVEIEGIRTLKNSCTVKVQDCLARGANSIVVKTNTERVKKTVKNNLELIAASHRFECWRCPREHNCELLHLLRKYNIPNTIGENNTFAKKEPIFNITDSIVLDSSKCILCGRCISACEKLAGTKVLDFNSRGFDTFVGPALNHNMEDSGCIFCGKCIQACPVGAIKEKDDVDQVIELLEKKEYYLIAQTAPAVRAALGEEFGYPIGTNVEGKMYKAIQELGFDDVTDTNFAADVTIMEEGTELIGRLNKFLAGEKVALPLLTSCSPGWIRYIETYYPQYLDHLSSCKSPQQMQGALIKNYYAEKIGVDKNKIKVVSIMPCIAKKFESHRPEMEVDGLRDVDYVLTTREFARLVKRQGIDFNNLPNASIESPLGKYTGAGAIFGVTGGVMEAALRTVKELLEKKDMKNVVISEVRGADNGIKEATLNINGLDLNFAVVHGTVNVPEMFERINKGEKKYAFIEVMGCTGGCVNGGGQPVISAKVQDRIDVRKERAKAIYGIDDTAKLRESHKNPEVVRLYEEFLKEPCGHVSHKLLHTHYVKREKYSKE